MKTQAETSYGNATQIPRIVYAAEAHYRVDTELLISRWFNAALLIGSLCLAPFKEKVAMMIGQSRVGD